MPRPSINLTATDLAPSPDGRTQAREEANVSVEAKLTPSQATCICGTPVESMATSDRVTSVVLVSGAPLLIFTVPVAGTSCIVNMALLTVSALPAASTEKNCTFWLGIAAVRVNGATYFGEPVVTGVPSMV